MSQDKPDPVFGNWLFAQPCQFVLGAVSGETLPPPRLPEIAFAGRSNVGKSSLINALTGRKTLAKTSVTPGRTQEVNFFNLADRLMIVDLPGYGFAQAPHKKVKTWQKLIRLYLSGRPVLRRVCVLIDARHGVKDVDQEIMTLLDDTAVSYQVILTKADKLKPAELAKVLAATETVLAKHPAAFPQLYATSAVERHGIEDLRAELATLAKGAKT